jgi:Xaa-Pro aminopeptidase
LASRDERRAFISGFDGSAGTCVVTQNEALLWTDGRYYQQASNQLDSNWKLMKDGLPTTPTIANWLAKNCKEGEVIGVDGNLISTRLWNSLNSSIETSGCTLKPVSQNLVDLVWGDAQPAAPQNKIIPLDIQYAGKSVSDKAREVRDKMLENNANVLVLTALDEIACKFSSFRFILESF